MNYDVIIIGGGAAGFFTAINVAENNPKLKIAILERGKDVLSKVRVSGGGRCNVTHAEFIPNELSKNYPRGEKELKGPFNTFMTGDTMAWLLMCIVAGCVVWCLYVSCTRCFCDSEPTESSFVCTHPRTFLVFLQGKRKPPPRSTTSHPSRHR